MVIESKDASDVAETLGRSLLGVARNPANFKGLPDGFWGYYARGHDGKGVFGVFVAYSESGSDIDEMLSMYEDWAGRKTEGVK